MNGKVCLGKIARKRYKTEARAKKLLQEAVEAFWYFKFTKNWYYCDVLYQAIRIEGVAPFRKIEDYLEYWQQKTKENPNWVPDKNFFGITREEN